jgi:predicted MPP superfamily phosphohydrolase
MNRRTFLKSKLFASGVSLASGSAYALGSLDLQVSRQQVPLRGIRQKMRIVALSDLHAPCRYLSTPDLVHTINKQKPDVLILAGDMFGVPEFEETISAFRHAKAQYAKLAILGNREYQLNLNRKNLKKAYADAGIKLLTNDTCEFNGLKIVGLDDLLYGSPDYKLAHDISNDAVPGLIVSHCPGSFDRLTQSSQNHKIMIAGHTHGGQIAPFGRALFTPKGSGRYVRGRYRKGNNSMYVMRGVGAPYLPLRIGTRPELLALDLLPI